jgi:predicted MFS family arabinose efflux permease
LATPLLAGVILAGVVGTPGYLIVFSLTLTALLLALWQSRKLPSDPAVRRGYSAWRFLKQYVREPVVRYMLLTIFFFGLREALFAFYLNILVFELAGGSELAVGVTTTLKGVGAMLMFLFIGKLLTPKMRTDGPLYIYLMMLAVCSALLLFTNMWMVAAVSVLDAVCMGFIGNSTQFSSYEVMDHFQRRCPEHDLRLEMVPVRNAALSFGRVAGMALFFLLPFPSGSVLPLVIFTAAALPCALFIKLTETGLKRAGYRA